MTDIINSEDENVRTVQTNATMRSVLTMSDNSAIIPLPAVLANGYISVNFTSADIPVLSGVTGNMTVTAQYQDGPVTSIGTLNFASAIQLMFSGKYTQLNITLNALSGADTVIVYVDQLINVLPSSADGGAIALTVTSDDDTVTQNGSSSYNAGTRTISVDLSATSLPGEYAFLMNGENSLSTGAGVITWDDVSFVGSSGITLLGDNQTIEVANNIKGFFTLQIQALSNINTDTIVFSLDLVSGDGTAPPNALSFGNYNTYWGTAPFYIDTTGSTPAQYQVLFNNSAIDGDITLSSQTTLTFQQVG